jgi:heme-degrading monooxygenase HmoA
MAETYTSGTWIVKPGDEDDFVAAWEAMAAWAAEMPGAGTFLLVRDTENAGHFMSFGAWESFEAQEAWKAQPEFRERLGAVRSHCDDFTPSVFELAARI